MVLCRQRGGRGAGNGFCGYLMGQIGSGAIDQVDASAGPEQRLICASQGGQQVARDHAQHQGAERFTGGGEYLAGENQQWRAGGGVAVEHHGVDGARGQHGIQPVCVGRRRLDCLGRSGQDVLAITDNQYDAGVAIRVRPGQPRKGSLKRVLKRRFGLGFGRRQCVEQGAEFRAAGEYLEVAATLAQIVCKKADAGVCLYGLGGNDVADALIARALEIQRGKAVVPEGHHRRDDGDNARAKDKADLCAEIGESQETQPHCAVNGRNRNCLSGIWPGRTALRGVRKRQMRARSGRC